MLTEAKRLEIRDAILNRTHASKFQSSPYTLAERFWALVEVKGPDDCWLWIGAASKSGRRRVVYGTLRETKADGGKPTRGNWRANILAALMRPETQEDVPPETDEAFIAWLWRAKRYYQQAGLEVGHTCDVSLCCNPAHLLWQSHGENVRDQRAREAAANDQDLQARRKAKEAQWERLGIRSRRVEPGPAGGRKLTREDLGLPPLPAAPEE